MTQHIDARMRTMNSYSPRRPHRNAEDASGKVKNLEIFTENLETVEQSRDASYNSSYNSPWLVLVPKGLKSSDAPLTDP